MLVALDRSRSTTPRPRTLLVAMNVCCVPLRNHHAPFHRELEEGSLLVLQQEVGRALSHLALRCGAGGTKGCSELREERPCVCTRSDNWARES